MVPDVNVSGQKFCIKLLVPSPEGMSEIYLRCQDVSRLDQGGNRSEGVGVGLKIALRVKVNTASPYSPLLCPCSRNNSTHSGWLPADWPPRAAPWQTAAMPARCRPFWPSSACSGQAVAMEAQGTNLRVLKPLLRALTPMASWLLDSSESSRPSRYLRKWGWEVPHFPIHP